MEINIYFSAFQPGLKMSSDHPQDQSFSDSGSTRLERTTLVCATTQTISEELSKIPTKGKQPITRGKPKRLIHNKSPSAGASLLRSAMNRKNLPPKVLEHVMCSWREKTKTQYAVYHRKWQTYCVLKQIDQLSPDLNDVLSFLVNLFDLGLRYSGLNSARSALSCVLPDFEGHKFGSHPLTVRLLRSFYNKRPPQVRYSEMWDPDIVIDNLREMSPINELSVKKISLKFTMLFLLATCSRQQRLCSIKRSNIKFQDDGSVAIQTDELQKHSSRGKSLEIVVLQPFNDDRSICVVQNLKMYLRKTKDLTNAGDALLCSYVPPYKAVGTQTVARWTKTVMKDSGIDTQIFKAHSTRGSSASKMAKMGTPLKDILKRGCWSDESTFKHFYLRDIN